MSRNKPVGSSYKYFVVDRLEGKMAILVDDSEKITEIKAAMLPAECRAEGAVLRVPIVTGNEPEWTSARRDQVEEKRRLDEGAARLDRLRKRDPGGDISL